MCVGHTQYLPYYWVWPHQSKRAKPAAILLNKPKKKLVDLGDYLRADKSADFQTDFIA